MTAKEIAEKIYNDEYYYGKAEQAIKEYALQVATEAVEEEINEQYDSLTNIGKQIHDLACDRVLINIKKRLDADND